MSSSVTEKAKNIKLLILDVDGVLTQGHLVYTAEKILYKSFHVQDGLGIKLLKKTGVEIGIITSCKSDIIRKRAADLGIMHIYQGYEDKLIPYQELKEKLQLTDAQIAYVGDDLPDLPLILRAGLGMTVPDALPFMHQRAAYVTSAHGGKGAVREVCELIMQAQGTYSDIMNSYLV